MSRPGEGSLISAITSSMFKSSKPVSALNLSIGDAKVPPLRWAASRDPAGGLYQRHHHRRRKAVLPGQVDRIPVAHTLSTMLGSWADSRQLPRRRIYQSCAYDLPLIGATTQCHGLRCYRPKSSKLLVSYSHEIPRPDPVSRRHSWQPLQFSIVARALQRGQVSLDVTDIRDYTHDAHGTADDYQFGGGLWHGDETGADVTKLPKRHSPGYTERANAPKSR